MLNPRFYKSEVTSYCLVPNHLSTHKNYQSTPSISHPYSLLLTTFTPSNLKTTTLHQSGEEKRRVGEKKRVAARGKKAKRGADEHRRWRKRDVEKVREVHIDTNP